VRRQFGKHNITGSEAHQPRPMAYMRKGFVSRRSRRKPRVALTVILITGLAILLAGWLFK